jgi:hypothetical protein
MSGVLRENLCLWIVPAKVDGVRCMKIDGDGAYDLTPGQLHRKFEDAVARLARQGFLTEEASVQQQCRRRGFQHSLPE